MATIRSSITLDSGGVTATTDGNAEDRTDFEATVKNRRVQVAVEATGRITVWLNGQLLSTTHNND